MGHGSCCDCQVALVLSNPDSALARVALPRAGSSGDPAVPRKEDQTRRDRAPSHHFQEMAFLGGYFKVTEKHSRCEADTPGKERGGFPEAPLVSPAARIPAFGDLQKTWSRTFPTPGQLGRAMHGSHARPCRRPFSALTLQWEAVAMAHAAPQALSLKHH